MAFSSLFQLQYIFIYKYFEYSWILWPLYIWTLITPLIGRLTKNYELTAHSLHISASLQAAVLIYCAGALQAPGVFWLSIFPISGGILLGRKGALTGVSLVILTIIFYFTAQYAWIVPNIVRDLNLYEQQRVVNYVTYMIFSVWLVFYFLSYESRAQAEVRRHKLEVENLLHILMHDVAGPLGVIEMDIMRLQNKLTGVDVGKSLDRMQRNINNIGRILSYIKDMKAVKDGKIQSENLSTDLCQALKMTLDNLTERIEKKNIKIVLESNIDHCEVIGDGALLQNVVFNNLLVNAIKFSSNGGLILIVGSEDQDYVYVDIQDHGIGIPAPILENIFKLSYKTSRVGTDGERGSGYGMLLVKEYIEKIGGSIKISSTESGKGPNPSGTLIKLKFCKFNEVDIT